MSLPVLLIGGLDSSGGAGLLRDVATATGLGADTRAAATAITAQSDRIVAAVAPVPAAMLAAQIRSALETPVGAVKIGMLGTAENVMAVAGALPDVPVVLDPVLASTSGRDLIDPEGVRALIDHLLPRATVLTPNLVELRVLGRALGVPAERAEQTAIVRALFARGCGAVLVKGGHGPAEAASTDRLYLADGQETRFSGVRYAFDLRGTGCQLATAIAVHLSRGTCLAHAVLEARETVTRRFELAAEIRAEP